jgi:site-specific DNA-methyltransferase (adenine-specific)
MEKMTEVVIGNYRSAFENYLGEEEATPLLFLGDALAVLEDLPDSSIDCVLTSPPYWGKREYESGGIGLEKDYRDYLRYLAQVALEIKRVLKPTESFWLNIGDSYWRKSLLGIPWRLALDLTDRQGWILRNAVVWDKVKGGMDSAPDRLANVYETVFHFVKRPKGYYYDLDAIRAKPQRAKVVNGKALSATGVSGVRYRQQIESSTTLSEEEKTAARKALDEMLANLAAGKISDFRMVIRGQQRPTHSDSEKVSGRAKELREKGFYFLRYHPKGSKPNDVWRILPEDSQGRSLHFAPFPIELARIPILATCPPGGIVLDPFCGTGTTLCAALSLGRQSVGIDISRAYLQLAQRRCAAFSTKLKATEDPRPLRGEK